MTQTARELIENHVKVMERYIVMDQPATPNESVTNVDGYVSILQRFAAGEFDSTVSRLLSTVSGFNESWSSYSGFKGDMGLPKLSYQVDFTGDLDERVSVYINVLGGDIETFLVYVRSEYDMQTTTGQAKLEIGHEDLLDSITTHVNVLLESRTGDVREESNWFNSLSIS
jgi:hypothetical protein